MKHKRRRGPWEQFRRICPLCITSFELQYIQSDHSYKWTAQSAVVTGSAAVLPSLPPCLCPFTRYSTCQHFTRLKPLCCPAALPRALHYTPTSSRPALPLCCVTRGGAVEGRCLLQLVMRSAVSTSLRLLCLLSQMKWRLEHAEFSCSGKQRQKSSPWNWNVGQLLLLLQTVSQTAQSH